MLPFLETTHILVLKPYLYIQWKETSFQAGAAMSYAVDFILAFLWKKMFSIVTSLSGRLLPTRGRWKAADYYTVMLKKISTIFKWNQRKKIYSKQKKWEVEKTKIFMRQCALWLWKLSCRWFLSVELGTFVVTLVNICLLPWDYKNGNYAKDSSHELTIFIGGETED